MTTPAVATTVAPVPAKPTFARLAGGGGVLCWEADHQRWKCLDERRHRDVHEIPATRITVGNLGKRCIRTPFGRWRCDNMARDRLIGPTALEEWEAREKRDSYESFVADMDQAEIVRQDQWYSCGLKDGAVACQGVGGSGELGGSTKWAYLSRPSSARSALSRTPVPVPNTSGAVDVFALPNRACALIQPSGELRCWGGETGENGLALCHDYNGKGTYPQSMKCTPTPPRTVPGLLPLQQVVADTNGLMAALTKDGDILVGQLPKPGETLTRLSNLKGPTAIALAHGGPLCVATPKEVLCWRLSLAPDGTLLPVNQAEVAHYPKLAHAKELALLNAHPCIRKADDTIWCGTRAAGRRGETHPDEAEQL